MPLLMYKTYDIPSQYSPEEQEMYKSLIDLFRVRVGDDIPEDNILYEKTERYSDKQIIAFFNSATTNINSSDIPITKYTTQNLYQKVPDLLVLGAMVFMCIREGLFQAANGIDFSDSGLSIGMYNKTGIYQGWYGVLLQNYMTDRKNFKSGEIISSSNSGFVSIGSEYSYRVGNGYYT